MVRLLGIAVAGAFLCGEALTQQPVAQPRFEIADVHVSAKTSAPRMRSFLAPSGRYEIRSATMVDLIQAGYSFEPDKILGGPNWLETDRFDVVALARAGAAQETLRAMLRSLLADRFKLVVHNENKPVPAYVLRAGAKPLLKPANHSGDAGCKPEAPSASLPEGAVRGTMMGVPAVIGPDRTIRYICRNVTMAAFAETIPSLPGANIAYRPVPVLDRTGLQGTWDFELRWSFAPALALPEVGEPSGWISIFNAMEKQLGLKLEKEPVPTPAIVVDSVNERPTANPPGVAAALPVISLPEKFDVAAIKPTEPGPGAPRLPRYQVQPGGKLVVEAMTLSALVNRALAGGDPVVGLPDWAGGERFDIIAEPPPTSAVLDTETVAPMLHALLVERFKLATRTEKRPVSVYELVESQPKMKKADPENRAHCTNGPAEQDTPPALARMIRCQNTTMAQFADQLRSLASGAIDLQVVDATQFAGAWDFSLSFSPPALLRPRPAGPEAEASTPNGAISIFDALKKQLGLTLQKGTREMPVIVVDRLEKKPTDN
jgi:uncharacterized protein (TIGR03435 family)